VDLHWEDKTANFRQFDAKIEAIGTSTDLILLPEMFTTGFSMNAAALAEPMDGLTMEYLAKWATNAQAIVTGSFIAREKGHFFNRLVWMRPDGTYQTYDKRHLFTLADEHLTYTAGTEKLIVDLKGWKICPLICYDLRFPVWSRNTESYDLLLYVANFPAKRSAAWKSLLTARAVENEVYTIGVNRVGTDGKGHYYSGDSRLIDFEGRVLYQLAHLEDCFTAELSYTRQQDFRKRFAFLDDRDHFTIQ
jgi:predicted amidohydrolase